MRPLLNAPDTRLTTLQTEEEEDGNVYHYSGGDDPEDATEYDNLLKNHHVCMHCAVEFSFFENLWSSICSKFIVLASRLII